MRYTLLIATVVFLLFACKKDKFTNTPVISYTSIKPNTLSGNLPVTGQTLPVLTFHITDGDGNIGFNAGVDTAFIYITNMLTNTSDSFAFPNLSSVAGKNFEADVNIVLNTANLLKASTRPIPKTDTLTYQVYVKDFKKNQSNTIVSGPVYFIFH